MAGTAGLAALFSSPAQAAKRGPDLKVTKLRLLSSPATPLACRLDVLSAPATAAKVVGYGSHAGTFGAVTGSGFTISHDSGGVNVHAPGHLTVADGPAPAEAAPAPAPPVAAVPELELRAAAFTHRRVVGTAR